MSTSELRSGALMPTRRIEAALEHLLDPLDLPDSAIPARSDPPTARSNGRPAPERSSDGGTDRVWRSARESLSDRFSFEGRLPWSGARGYALARIALIAVLAGLCGVGIALLDSTLLGL